MQAQGQSHDRITEKMLATAVDNFNCSSYPQLTTFNTSALRPVDAF
jgi:hypothetical protein